MKCFLNFIIAVNILFFQNVFADPPYELMEITFKNQHDAIVFEHAYSNNKLTEYFSDILLSEPQNMSDCMYQKYFLNRHKINKKTVSIVVADEISYYNKISKKEFSGLLKEWSTKIPVVITHHVKDHFSYNETFIIANGMMIKKPNN